LSARPARVCGNIAGMTEHQDTIAAPAAWRAGLGAACHGGGAAGRWLRRSVLAFAALVLAAWIAVPIAVRHVGQAQGTQLLGRPMRIGAVHFNPLTLRMRLEDVAIAGARPGEPDAFAFRSLELALKWRTIWAGAPVASEAVLEAPVVRLARTAPGHFDADDIFSRMLERKSERGHALGWAVYNIRIEHGRIEFDDRPVQRRHVVEDLTLGVPFVSTLPADQEISVQPRLAFVLDGARYDSQAQATPFHLDRMGTFVLHTGDIALAPWLPYWPAALGWRPTRGRLRADTTLDFSAPPAGPARWTLAGEVRLDDLALVDAAGAPLASWRGLALRMREIRPFDAVASFERITLDGVDLALDRDARGELNLVRAFVRAPEGTPAAAAPAGRGRTAKTAAPPPASAGVGSAAGTAAVAGASAGSAASAGAASAPAAPAAPPWRFEADTIEATGRIGWRDAGVTPAAIYAVEDLRVRLDDVRWPPRPGAATAVHASAPASPAATASAVAAPAVASASERPSVASASTMPSVGSAVTMPAAAATSSRPGASAGVVAPAPSGAMPAPAGHAAPEGTRVQLAARFVPAVSTVASTPAAAASAPGRAKALQAAASAAAPGGRPAGPGGAIALEGRIGAAASELEARIDRVALGALRPYLASHWTPPTDGELSARVQARWDGMPDTAPSTVDVAQLAIDDLRLAEAGRAAPAAAWRRVQLEGLHADLERRRVALERLSLAQPEIWLARDAGGVLNVAHWLGGGAPAAPSDPSASAPAAAPATSTPATKAPATNPPASAPPAAGAGWQTRVGSVAVSDGRLHWRDAPGAGPVAVDVDTLQLNLDDAAWPADGRSLARLKLKARVMPGDRSAGAGAGRLAFEGSLGLAPLAWQGRLRAERLPLHAIDAYIAAVSPLQLLHADVGWRGTVAGSATPAGLKLDAQGDALLTDLHARARYAAGPAASADDLLSWQSLAVHATDLALAPAAPPRVSLGDVELIGAFARLVVTEEGRFNLADLAPPAAASAPAAGQDAASTPLAVSAPSAAVGPAQATASAPGADIRVGGIHWSETRVQYTDRFIRPNYSAELSDLSGSLGAFSTRTPDLAPLELKGRVEGTGLLDVQGRLNPLARPLALDISARAHDIELAPLSPYAGKYAGYAIERGKLSMNVHYQVQPDGRLQATNQIVLNQLTFGDKVDSPSATKLPVLFAVSLLKDRNGVIDVNLPIGGSLNDPQFSVGGIIWKLILNLLEKAITAPFSLLAGGGEHDLSQVLFVPGTPRLEAGADETLDKVAKALQDRPGVQLTITGLADADQEHADLQAANLDARLVGLRRTELLQSGETAVPDAPTLSPEDRSRLVRRLYADTKLPDKPRNVLGIAKDIPQAEMETRLKAGLPLPADAARALAVQRAAVVRDALVARGLPNERMFVAAPKVHGAGSAEPGDWLPHAQLELSSR
jgi:hypothetical protein